MLIGFLVFPGRLVTRIVSQIRAYLFFDPLEALGPSSAPPTINPVATNNCQLSEFPLTTTRRIVDSSGVKKASKPILLGSPILRAASQR
jgi:hypothetical protein